MPIKNPPNLLAGAYDLHVHAAPDCVPRAQSAFDLASAAKGADMAGVGLKDHTTSTVGRCAVLNALHDHTPRFFSSIVLNPSVGGLNVSAIEAALSAGCDIVYFPTFGARFQIETQGRDTMPYALDAEYAGLTIFRRDDSSVRHEVVEILSLIQKHDAVLATGHLSPRESIALLTQAKDVGIQRSIVTHASEPVPGMSVDDQRRCAELGALIEHCLMACTACCHPPTPIEEIAVQIRELGAENVIVSSDFGQVDNGPPVDAFREHLLVLQSHGIMESDIRTMIVDNPARLMLNRNRPS